MRLILFGPPGSGKGTYASRLAPILGIAKVDLGDIFREEIKAQAPLGKKVAQYVNRGKLVPDEITIEVLKERINQPDCEKGFILDDYPRTIAQAEALDKIIKIDLVINLNVPDEIIIERLSTRIVCKSCGTIYNERYLKPKKAGICDKCGGRLIHREDDRPSVIKERLKVYQEQTAPLIEYYKNKNLLKSVACRKIDIPPEVIIDKILSVLKESNLLRS